MIVSLHGGGVSCYADLCHVACVGLQDLHHACLMALTSPPLVAYHRWHGGTVSFAQLVLIANVLD